MNISNEIGNLVREFYESFYFFIDDNICYDLFDFVEKYEDDVAIKGWDYAIKVTYLNDDMDECLISDITDNVSLSEEILQEVYNYLINKKNEKIKLINEIYSLILELKNDFNFSTIKSEQCFEYLQDFDLGIFSIPKNEKDNLSFLCNRAIGFSSHDIYNINKNYITLYNIFDTEYYEFSPKELIALRIQLYNLKNIKLVKNGIKH